ncbi:MAG TPA: NifU family protein [Nocardioidaceae bacterium]|nr:NifU family protein [Nocardioidaceae bacterium]
MEQPSVREVSERIDSLLEELSESIMPAALDRVEELVRSVMALYGAGLDRIVSTFEPELVRRLAEDDVVGNLLVLHDLHPDDVDTRVQRALDGVRPYLGSHAGGVSLSSVDERGVVHLQLEGSCDGCPSSAMTVKNAIEEAILMAAPDVVAVEAEGMVVDSGPSLLQIQPFREHETTASEGGWTHLELDVPPRTMQQIDAAGEPLLVANLDGTLVAYLDRCPSCFGALSAGQLTGDVLACTQCGHSYDVRLAGRALADDGTHLAPLPLLPDHAHWKVALPGGVTQ